MKIWQFVVLLAEILLVGGILILKRPVNIQQIQWNLSDREHGICAPMYKEGFDWGVGQFKLDFNLQEEEYARKEAGGERISREQRAYNWYLYFEEAVKN